MRKKLFIFIIAVAVSTVGAVYRPGDSAHSMGVIKADGGEAKRPVTLTSGKDAYTLVVSATVVPPFRGDARVVMEGGPAPVWEAHLGGPAVDLGFKRRPEYVDGIISGMRPKDRVTLWLRIRPPEADPVCGMAREEGFIPREWRGKDYHFCSAGCLEKFMSDPSDGGYVGKCALALLDTKTGKAVFRAPVVFAKKGEGGGDGGHQH